MKSVRHPHGAILIARDLAHPRERAALDVQDPGLREAPSMTIATRRPSGEMRGHQYVRLPLGGGRATPRGRPIAARGRPTGIACCIDQRSVSGRSRPAPRRFRDASRLRRRLSPARRRRRVVGIEPHGVQSSCPRENQMPGRHILRGISLRHRVLFAGLQRPHDDLRIVQRCRCSISP